MWSRLSVDDDRCKAGLDCPSVWANPDTPDDLVIVGTPIASGAVPTGEGEVAVRIRRKVIVDAGIE